MPADPLYKVRDFALYISPYTTKEIKTIEKEKLKVTFVMVTKLLCH